MTSDFRRDIEDGRIFRKQICKRCSAVDNERLTGIAGSDWEEYPTYEGRGFGAIVIVPYAKGMERMETTLCPDCTAQLGKLIAEFLGISEEGE